MKKIFNQLVLGPGVRKNFRFSSRTPLKYNWKSCQGQKIVLELNSYRYNTRLKTVIRKDKLIAIKIFFCMVKYLDKFKMNIYSFKKEKNKGKHIIQTAF